jgi:nicotinamide-nucleotide adenylyltransferase
LKEVEELVIVVGSAQYSHTISNPFTAGERLTMINLALNESGLDCHRVWLIPVPDVHLHMLWVAALEGYTPKFEVVYSNEPLTKRLFTEAGYMVRGIRFFERKIYSSTDIRARMADGREWEKLVPKSVAKFIAERDGVNRIVDLKKSDKI